MKTLRTLVRWVVPPPTLRGWRAVRTWLLFLFFLGPIMLVAGTLLCFGLCVAGVVIEIGKLIETPVQGPVISQS